MAREFYYTEESDARLSVPYHFGPDNIRFGSFVTKTLGRYELQYTAFGRVLVLQKISGVSEFRERVTRFVFVPGVILSSERNIYMVEPVLDLDKRAIIRKDINEKLGLEGHVNFGN